MTPRQRFLACLHQEPADRPSVANAVSIATVYLMEQTGCFFPEAHLDPDAMAGLAAAGHEVLGYDTIAPVFSVTQESAAIGCDVNWGRKDMMPDVIGRLCDRADQIDVPTDFLHHNACRGVLEALRRLRASYPDVALIGKVFGPWTLAYHLFGIEPFLVMTLDDPPQVHEILQRLKHVAVVFAAAQLQAGADAITLGDHATGDLVSGAMYHEFLYPVHCELAGAIPGPVILHICGDTADRLAAISNTGFTCFHFDSKVPARRAREIVDVESAASSVVAVPPRRDCGGRGLGPRSLQAAGGAERGPAENARVHSRGEATPEPTALSGPTKRNITLMGSINNPHTLLHGTPKDVWREVQECLNCGIEIIAPECAIPLTTPTANLQAIAQATRALFA
jgi:[methyl-Co(III) methanol-specific corrinoid protein]:coenzyme M methyltransferase